MTASGPLQGVRIVEIASIGPGPFAAMMLADLGADVIRLDRRGGADGSLATGAWNLMNRGRRSAAVDLKHPGGRELVLELCEAADALVEGFRPGVMERLGLGPDDVLARNPQLVYGRMTGYGQDGPLAAVAGHDINYISIAGVLGAMRRQGERPMFPLNLVGGLRRRRDVAGARVVLRRSSRRARRARARSWTRRWSTARRARDDVPCAAAAPGMWGDEPGTNLLDSGAHFYEVYESADGGHVAVGAIEPQFYAELLRLLELDPDDFPQWDRARWPELKAAVRRRVRDAHARRVGAAARAGRGVRHPCARRSTRRRRTPTTPRAARSS